MISLNAGLRALLAPLLSSASGLAFLDSELAAAAALVGALDSSVARESVLGTNGSPTAP